MKEWLKNRDNWHIIGGVLLEVAFYFITFEAYQMIGRFLISTIIVAIGCTLWEMARKDIFNYKFDWKDIKRGVIPAAITGVLCVLVHAWIIGKFI